MRTVIVDTTKDEYPKFLYKETENTDNGYLMCEVALKDGEDYRGRVISISSNGKYKVELLEEV